MNQTKINTKAESILASKQEFTPAELDILRMYEPNEGRDRLYSFFTPQWVAEIMFKLAGYHGYDGGPILEPAAGTGNILEVLPHHLVTAFETNPDNVQIAHARAPKANIYLNYFETAFLEPPRFRRELKKQLTWLKGYPFSLVIGNPPYGKYSGRYARYFPKHSQLETFFMIKGLELLKPGGLLVFITASAFMSNMLGYRDEKVIISEMADLVDAYRLPKVFKNTDVPTDIIVLKKK